MDERTPLPELTMYDDPADVALLVRARNRFSDAERAYIADLLDSLSELIDTHDALRARVAHLEEPK